VDLIVPFALAVEFNTIVDLNEALKACQDKSTLRPIENLSDLGDT